MMDSLSKISISEVILLFLLLFLLPLFGLILLRLREYERAYGQVPESGGGKPAEKELPPPEPAKEATKEDEVPGNVYPYKVRAFLSPADRACLVAMREALGPEVEIYPKVALWELVEATDKAPGFLKRLHDKDYDFLVCDRKTGLPLTAVMYNPGKGRPAGNIDEVRKICQAAGVNVVFIDMAEEYDAASLKEALGIPDLDI